MTAKKAFLIYFCSNESRSSLAVISVKKMVVVGGGRGEDFHMLHSFIMHTCVCENFILENGEKQITFCPM